jgi:hypothetical protein
MFNPIKTGGKHLQSSHGMVLMSALTILTVLLAVGIGIRVMLQNDYRVLSNLRGGTEAFYYSAAGLEWSKNELARDVAFPPVPTNQAKSFASGGFAVSFPSPTVVGPLTATFVVRSVGTVRTTSQVLQAQLTKAYDLADGALGLRGSAARVNLGGGATFISGVDHDPANGNPLPEAKSRSAVTVADDALRDLFMQALGSPPPTGVLESAIDVPVLSPSGHVPATVIAQLANDICVAPGVSLHSIPSDGSLSFENQLWGSRLSPQLHCIEGLSTPGDAVSFAGNMSGAGVLVVRNADLNLSGSFRWEGLVIVSGQELGLKVSGATSKEILGAVLVNETGNPGSSIAILDIQGNLRLLFSREALRRAAKLIPSATLKNTYGALPSFVSQDYWRTASP